MASISSLWVELKLSAEVELDVLQSAHAPFEGGSEDGVFEFGL